MNDLERLIHALPLSSPSKSLDDRIAELLSRQQPAEVECVVEEPGSIQTDARTRVAQRTIPQNGVVSQRRGLASVIVSVAGVCLLMGIAFGQTMVVVRTMSASLSSQEAGVVADRIPHSATVSRQRLDSEAVTFQSALSESPPVSFDPVFDSESTRTSPALLGALRWEMQTGRVFDIATHVGSRTFDACRSCHPAGS